MSITLRYREDNTTRFIVRNLERGERKTYQKEDVVATETKVREVEAKWEYRGNLYVLIVHCPFCGQQHTHGAGIVQSAGVGGQGVTGPSKEYYGHRGAHCGAGEYILVKKK